MIPCLPGEPIIVPVALEQRCYCLAAGLYRCAAGKPAKIHRCSFCATRNSGLLGDFALRDGGFKPRDVLNARFQL